MLQEIVGKLSTGELTFIGLLLTLAGTVIAGVVAIITSFINGWFNQQQVRNREIAETDRQSRELAVQLALEKWKTANQTEKEKHDRAVIRDVSKGFVREADFIAPPIASAVMEMWQLTENLKPKKPKKAPLVSSWGQWAKWPFDRLCDWWLSR